MILGITLVALAIAALFAAIRVVMGPSLADRVAALDVMLVALMSGIAANAGARGDSTNLDILVVIAIVAFTATVAASRFIEHEDSEIPTIQNPDPIDTSGPGSGGTR